MISKISKEIFCERNRIEADTWELANIDWKILQGIAVDHQAQSANLEVSAELFAKVIQKFSAVHSVRWRVKDAEHLIAKIVRKRAEKTPKYADITIDNYFELVTDLVGIRALHLFKEDCFEIDAALKRQWSPIEVPVAYMREGDSKTFKARFESNGFEVKDHPAGYRSVHYVIASTPIKRKIISEIQVRTIFEEGWSEIDHKVRYPNFSENELISYFLEIFNRMAGSADDMGGFVLGLVDTLTQMADEISSEKNKKDSAFADMEKALSQLENVKKQDEASRASVATLKAELQKLKVNEQGEISSIASSPTQYSFAKALVDFAAGMEQINRMKQLNDVGGSAAYKAAFKFTDKKGS
ncbi:MAG: RelA/SpoT domain-containing protein [Gallionella sp.]